MFDAILIEKTETGQSARLARLSPDQLPQGDVTVDVGWSTLNYKDALAITGASPVVRSFPMVPGIDLAGRVAASDHPDFRPGDTLRVGVKVVEGERSRVQNYEGVCIARSNKSIGSNFTVRKISFGEGVERVFPLYSPNIDSITVVRKGAVRRAKLYYLRGRRGKSARIAERRDNRTIGGES